MTPSHHGAATLTIDAHDGVFEYVLDVEGAKVRMTDQQARDVAHCFADEFPYSYVHPPVQPRPAPQSEFAMCRQCGHRVAQIPTDNPVFCGDECEHNWRQSEYRGWYPR